MLPIPEDLPNFVVIVSRGHDVLAYNHCDTLEDAHHWCERACALAPHADQVVIASVEQQHHIHAPPVLAKAPGLVAVTGWLRLSAWHSDERFGMRLSFGKMPDFPTPLEQLEATLTVAS